MREGSPVHQILLLLDKVGDSDSLGLASMGEKPFGDFRKRLRATKAKAQEHLWIVG